MAGFSSLNVAVTGLAAAQRAMDIVGQNVVNANTPGYSRQRVDVSSVGVSSAATMFSGTNASVGGVRIDGVARIRDAFLEGARAAAGGKLNALQSQNSVLTQVQNLLSEPGETGLQSTMDSFFTAWQDLAQRPDDSAAGAVVIQRGNAVADQLKFVSEGITSQWMSSQSDLSNVVSQTNQALTDLAGVNQKIRQGANAGADVNELEDQRDTLVRTLSDLVGASASTNSDGTTAVSVNGINVLDGDHAEKVTLTGAGTLANVASDPPAITWGTVTVPVASGKAAGLLAALKTDLPKLASQTDQVAVALRDVVNTTHQQGFTLAGAQGGDFFSGTDASTLGVVPTDPTELAVASTAGTVDGNNALALGDLVDERTARTVLGSEGPSELWRNMVANYGVKVQSVSNGVTVQQTVVASADSMVEADAGVSVDEEMSSMLLYQRAFEASSRIITTVDSMMDTLINRTGVGG